MIAKDLELDSKKYSARLLSTQISNLKNELIGPEEAVHEAETDSAATELTRVVARVYAHYQQRLRTANAFDFDDLIGETVALLQAHPQVAEYYRRRFRHVLVDEYQDTNHAQYVLVRTLVGDPEEESAVPPSELCVVGDADQSIYAFRGATIRNIEEFERDYPQARTILLEQNYRSTQNILSAANSVISKNTGRREKRLWTDSGEGELITGYVATTSTTRRGSSPPRSTGSSTAATPPTPTSRCSTAPTMPPARSRTSSSGTVCPTRSSAVCGSTSARRCATSLRT